MIEYEQLVKKLGKNGTKDFIANNRSNQPTGADKDRGIKGRVRFRLCQHGSWVIDDYKDKVCDKCLKEYSRPTKGKDFKPYFNIGLGCFVESRAEEKRTAKRKMLIENG